MNVVNLQKEKRKNIIFHFIHPEFTLNSVSLFFFVRFYFSCAKLQKYISFSPGKIKVWLKPHIWTVLGWKNTPTKLQYDWNFKCRNMEYWWAPVVTFETMSIILQYKCIQWHLTWNANRYTTAICMLAWYSYLLTKARMRVNEEHDKLQYQYVLLGSWIRI